MFTKRKEILKEQAKKVNYQHLMCRYLWWGGKDPYIVVRICLLQNKQLVLEKISKANLSFLLYSLNKDKINVKVDRIAGRVVHHGELNTYLISLNSEYIAHQLETESLIEELENKMIRSLRERDKKDCTCDGLLQVLKNLCEFEEQQRKYREIAESNSKYSTWYMAMNELKTIADRVRYCMTVYHYVKKTNLNINLKQFTVPRLRLPFKAYFGFVENTLCLKNKAKFPVSFDGSCVSLLGYDEKPNSVLEAKRRDCLDVTIAREWVKQFTKFESKFLDYIEKNTQSIEDHKNA